MPSLCQKAFNDVAHETLTEKNKNKSHVNESRCERCKEVVDSALRPPSGSTIRCTISTDIPLSFKTCGWMFPMAAVD